LAPTRLHAAVKAISANSSKAWLKSRFISISLFRFYSEKCSVRLYHASATLSRRIRILHQPGTDTVE
jgi:hypothetical protein